MQQSHNCVWLSQAGMGSGRTLSSFKCCCTRVTGRCPVSLCPQLYITVSAIFALPLVNTDGVCLHQAQLCHPGSGVRAEASVSSAPRPSGVLEQCWTCHPAWKCIQRAQEPSQGASAIKGGRLLRHLQACVPRPQ